MNVYRVRVFIWEKWYASKALAAGALGFTEAQLNSVVAANVAAGQPGFPVTTQIDVGFTGRLLGLVPNGTQAQVTVDEVEVIES